MIFENEINLFDPNAIANEFHAQSTQINVVQGKISAMISDSQISELQNGEKNMYDRLVSAEADISGITTQVSELRQTDGELESQISTIRQTATEISLDVSSVKNNYAQKAQIILAINNTTQQSETVINAEHISLAGKTINLTSDNIAINSTNFSVDKSGKITATAGSIGGFDITGTAIKTKNVPITSNVQNSIGLSSVDFTRTISGTSRSGLRFAIGANFGVTGTGMLYAANASLYGTFRNSEGNEWIGINESVITGGYGASTHGKLDLSAQYADGEYRVLLENKVSDIVLKVPANKRIYMQWGDSVRYNMITSGKSLGGNDYIEELAINKSDPEHDYKPSLVVYTSDGYQYSVALN